MSLVVGVLFKGVGERGKSSWAIREAVGQDVSTRRNMYDSRPYLRATRGCYHDEILVSRCGVGNKARSLKNCWIRYVRRPTLEEST